MIKKYRTCLIDPRIEEVECVRETEKFVFFDDEMGKYRLAKRSRYEVFHDTWDDAKEHLLEKSRRLLNEARAKARALETKVMQISAMERPDS